MEITDQAQWNDPLAILNLDDALAVLNEPLGILLENAENDWNFLCGIMRLSERNRIMAALNKGWAVSIHGGGSDLKTHITNRFAIPQQSLRTFVVFDSDRRHPDELEPSWRPTRPESCQGYDIEEIVRPKIPKQYWSNRSDTLSFIPSPCKGEGVKRWG